MGSNPQQLPYWGKSWFIRIQTQGGDTVTLSSNQFTEPLRVVFRVDTLISGATAYWPAEISIYNISAALATQFMSTGLPGAAAGQPQTWNFNQALAQGDLLSLSAGYQYSASGAFNPTANLIYQGHLFQPRWTRDHVVDSKITLRCYAGFVQDALNPINFSLASGFNGYTTVQQIIDQGKLKIGNITPEAQSILGKTVFPRGQVFSGSPYTALNNITNASKLQFWVGPNGVNIRSLNVDPGTVPVCVYGSPIGPGSATSVDQPGISSPNSTNAAPIKRTVIGTPEQTQQGVRFRVLMDAQPKIGDAVQLAAGTLINRVPLVIGNYPSILDKDGLYVVAGISHYGDTRGRQDDWYTQIDALTNNFFPNIGLATSPIVTP